MPTRSNLSSVSVCVFSLFLSAAAISFSGCDNKEAESLKIRLNEEKNRSAAYREDAAKLRSQIQKSNDAREQAEKQVAELKQKVDEISGIKALTAIGATLQRDRRGNVVSVNLVSKSFKNEDIEVLKNFSTIREVAMDGPSINLDTFKILGELPELRKLEASISATDTECLKQLAGLKHLAYLQLKRTSVTDESMEVLSKFPSLQQIRVGQTKVGDEGLKHLQNLKTLVALDLTDCNKVSDVGIGYLAKLPKLKMLKVWGKAISNEALNSIGEMESLEILGMNDTNIDDNGMSAINSLTRLKEVYFARTAVGDFGILQLTGATGIKKMVLRDTQITDEALSFIGKFKELEVLDLSECTAEGLTNNGITHLQEGTNKISDLNLWATKVSDGAVEAIAKMPHIVRLNLDATKVTDLCMEDLGTMVNLTWLHIGSTKISEAKIEELHKLKKLKYLNLSFTEASFSDDVDALYENLKKAIGESCSIVGLL